MTKSSSEDWSKKMASGGKPLWMSSPSGSTTKFSTDGKYAIVLMTYEIRVYFIGTRQCIRTISLDLHGVIDSYLDPQDPNQLILFKNDGEIITVNWKDKISQPIVSTQSVAPTTGTSISILSIVSVHRDFLYLITGKNTSASSNSSNSPSASISAHTRHIIKVNRASQEIYEVLEVANVTKYAISLNKKKVCFVTSNHECVLVDMASVLYASEVEAEEVGAGNVSKEVIPFAYRSPITSLAVSNESVVAIGTMAGAIQILYGGITENKSQRLLKWHIDHVRSLQFTPDGSYLLSGGLEKVLVFWQLDTDKTQFLPRLNGTIEKISIDINKPDFYSLLLKIPITRGSDKDENDSNKNNSNANGSINNGTFNNTNNEEDDEEASYEVLVVSAVDLVSRLSVHGIRPKFANSNIKSTLAKTKKRFSKLNNDYDVSKLKHDYSSIFEVHPKTQQLYFPRGATIQGYDLIRNEQSFIQNAAPLLTTGKVRSESKLIDPEISSLSFSYDGQWMCTFDTISTSEVDNLISKNDSQYALKFWKFIDTSNTSTNTPTSAGSASSTGHWELSTKIIDPHGPSNPILSITAAPSNYHNGLAFLTADNKGGLRIWRPRIPKEIYQNMKSANNSKLQQTAWTLRKSKPSGALVSNAVSTCWSEDGSIIILGHECSITAFNTHTLEEITQFQIPAMSGSRIRSLSILGNYLIVLSKTRITSFDLLSGTFTPLCAKVNTTLGAKNLIAIDKINELVCLAVNSYKENKESNQLVINSKILVFKPDQLKPVFSVHHDQGISSIRQFRSSFIFVDLNSRVGVVSSSTLSAKENIEGEDSDLSNDMSKMLIQAQAAADIVNSRAVSTTSRSASTSNVSNGHADEETQFDRTIDINTFQPIFENLDGVQIDSLFDKIVKIIK
ncbi:NET1-associated nuclear protein 1 [[Candida] railenensis]|uniref:NET1-associated nuclear protein 1 n=1 Tax=[Candida] railenensis TaxID=45579 RepID=A0A9P0W160_9ASCO|nr:NET1-associated nuclear protein 1 [[Candida] railenensis]